MPLTICDNMVPFMFPYLKRSGSGEKIADKHTTRSRTFTQIVVRYWLTSEHRLNVNLFVHKGQGMVEMWSTIPYNASLVDAVEMVVSPRHEKHVKDYLSCSGMTPTVVEENLQRAMDVENEIDPEETEGFEVVTRVTSKFTK